MPDEIDDTGPLKEENAAAQNDAQQPSPPPSSPQPIDMEVHHHPHAEKKGLKEYFLEFLMIFLAVTMGFFAESLREHLADKQKENQYIQSFYSDLSADELQLVRLSNSILVQQLRPADSLPALFRNADIKKPANDIYFFLRSMIRQQGIKSYITDRTIDQVKNAGEMRLISSKQVSDSLVDYYKQVDFIDYLQGVLLQYKTKLNEDFPLILRAVDYDKAIDQFDSIAKPSRDLFLGSADPIAINKIQISISEIRALSISIRNRIGHLQVRAGNIKRLLANKYTVDLE